VFRLSAAKEKFHGQFGYHVIDATGGRRPAELVGAAPAAIPMGERRRIKSHFANLPGVGVHETKGKAKLDMANRAGMTDPVARLADMDLEGIDQVVCFPVVSENGPARPWVRHRAPHAELAREFAPRPLRSVVSSR
jgi:hypothetical protein